MYRPMKTYRLMNTDSSRCPPFAEGFSDIKFRLETVLLRLKTKTRYEMI